MDLKEIGISTRNWVDSTQDRDYWSIFVNVELSFRSISHVVNTTVSMAYGTQRFNAVFTRALQ
jgi:hypothetical protein